MEKAKLLKDTSYYQVCNRKGKFTLDREMIIKDFDLVKMILSDVFVVRAENCFVTDTITYWAYSEYFEEISPGLIPPEYEIIITNSEWHGNTVEWRKRN
jgi:hypothetical protein